MSRFASLSRRLSIEDAELDMGDVEMVPAPEAEAPAAVAEVVEAGQDIDDGVAVINEASDDLEELDTVGSIVSDSIEPEVEGGAEGPGMEPVAAALAAETVRRLRKKWGLSSPQSIGAPALESFGRASSRKQATRLALLGFTDTIKKIWEKIKAFFKGLWDRIKSAVKSIFQSNVKTQQRAVALRKEVNAITNTSPKNDQFDAGSLAKAFGVKGKDVTVANVTTVLANHKKLMDNTADLNKGTSSFVGELRQAASTALANKTTGSSGPSNPIQNTLTQVEKAATTFGGTFKDIGVAANTGDYGDLLNELKKKFDKLTGKANEKYNILGPFVNSTFIYIIQATETVNSGSTSTTVAHIQYGTESIAESTNNSVKTLKKPEMFTVITEVIAGCESAGSVERTVKVGDAVSKEIADLSNTVISSVSDQNFDDPANHGQKEMINQIRAYVTTITSMMASVNGSMMVKNMSAMNYALDYVSSSIKQYKMK